MALLPLPWTSSVWASGVPGALRKVGSWSLEVPEERGVSWWLVCHTVASQVADWSSLGGFYCHHPVFCPQQGLLGMVLQRPAWMSRLISWGPLIWLLGTLVTNSRVVG